MYLYPAAVPDVSNTVGVTINGETVQLPANGIWFKPQAAGVAALAFAKTNNANPAKKMAIYKYQRNSYGGLTEVSKTTFELPRSLKNGAIVYYEYEITKEDVTQGYEYVIGAADSAAANGSAGFVALVLAGTDESSGDNPGGGDTPGDGKRVLNIDYIVSTDVDVSSSTYEMHQTLLEIPSSTSTIQGSIYYKAVGTMGNSTVNYYVPSMGITVNDISQTKQSVAASDASQFEPRQQSAS